MVQPGRHGHGGIHSGDTAGFVVSHEAGDFTATLGRGGGGHGFAVAVPVGFVTEHDRGLPYPRPDLPGFGPFTVQAFPTLPLLRLLLCLFLAHSVFPISALIRPNCCCCFKESPSSRSSSTSRV